MLNTTRFKRVLTMLRKKGVKYLVMTNGKLQAGDLGLTTDHSKNNLAARWRKVPQHMFGFPIKALSYMVKRPLKNIL